jgi:hypothetical protein
MTNERAEFSSSKKDIARIAILMAAFFCSSAWADWHTGFVTSLNSSYDGQTITLTLSNWTRSNCTCYSTWPSNMCLDKNRLEIFKAEFAMLWGAKLSERAVSVNIDETTCKVVSVSDAG